MIKKSLLIVPLLLLYGCSDEQDKLESHLSEQKETFIDAKQKAIEKAEQTQQVILDKVEATREEIESQTR